MMIRKIDERKKDTAKLSAKQSAEISANEWLSNNKNLIKKIAEHSAKLSLANYSLAIRRAREEPLEQIERRVMRQLSRRLSRDLYEQTQAELQKLSPLDAYDFLANMDERLRE